MYRYISWEYSSCVLRRWEQLSPFTLSQYLISVGVHERTRFGATYSINKPDFLEIYQEAWDKAITVENIKSAWRESGIHPYNLDLILSKLPVTKTKTSSCPSTATGAPPPVVNYTPMMTNDVRLIMDQIQLSQEVKILVEALKQKE